MDDGWGAFLAVLILAAMCLYAEWSDRRAGKHPRRWED